MQSTLVNSNSQEPKKSLNFLIPKTESDFYAITKEKKYLYWKKIHFL